MCEFQTLEPEVTGAVIEYKQIKFRQDKRILHS